MNPRRLTETELNAFVDGELAPDERSEVEAALSASPQDSEVVRHTRDLNEALRQQYSPLLHEPLPPAVQAQLDRFGRTSGT